MPDSQPTILDRPIDPLPPALPVFMLPDDFPLARPHWRLYKRAHDVILALAILLMVLPVMISIMFLIKFDSEGPIFFTQSRRGRHRALFPCIKFRTMHHHSRDISAHKQSARHDPRVTRIGRILRRTSMDELPQLINVLIGHMSLVGPRPHALGTTVNGTPLTDVAEHYMLRYKIKPGITGWAQINGWRGIIDTEEKLINRVNHDLHYIAHWKPWTDVIILFKTFSCVFDRNAF